MYIFFFNCHWCYIEFVNKKMECHALLFYDFVIISVLVIHSHCHGCQRSQCCKIHYELCLIVGLGY